jgi:integrase
VADDRLHPYGLRHSAATSALDDGRDVREVRKFTRHRSLEMVLKYDDQRRDVAGEIARDLADRRDDCRLLESSDRLVRLPPESYARSQRSR